MALQLRYTGLFVSDVAATVLFYKQAFGLRLRYMHPSMGYAELETGDTLLAFVGDKFIESTKLLGSLPYAASKPEGPAAASQIAFVTDDMNADWQRAVSSGAIVVKEPEPKPWGQVVGYLCDCNGAVVELCTRSPRDTA